MPPATFLLCGGGGGLAAAAAAAAAAAPAATAARGSCGGVRLGGGCGTFGDVVRLVRLRRGWRRVGRHRCLGAGSDEADGTLPVDVERRHSPQTRRQARRAGMAPEAAGLEGG